jgi:glutaminyl-peptide cyclotransferase
MGVLNGRRPEGMVMLWKSSVVLFVVAVLVASGCYVLSKPPAKDSSPDGPKDKETDFATGGGGGKGVPFDAKRSMDYLKAICDIGPRISGTEGMKKQQELIEKHFKALDAKVTYQKFTARQVSRRQATEMANLIVSFHPDRERRVILCSHYDTRPIADQERDERNWAKPFVSANDGGSGVALLMELGNHMKDLETKVGVDFVFFDGEEYIRDRDNDHYFFGSDYFADEYKKGKGKTKYVAAILLDMVAGKEMNFPAEGNSLTKAGALVESVWGVAKELKVKEFDQDFGPSVEDDHLALNRAGIPAIDVIDLTHNRTIFNYPHWHKLTDTPENCSGESMAKVARVLSVWLGRVK